MFSDPEHNIEQFALLPGAHVADLGAGSGAYSFAAAKAIAGGTVYAVDVQKDLLAKLKNEAQKQHIRNIEVIWGDLDKLGGTKLTTASMDAAIISNVLFQLERKEILPQELRRILKPSGRALVIDWLESFGNMGPHPDHVVNKDKAIELFSKAGFKLDHEISAGAHHYGLIFK